MRTRGDEHDGPRVVVERGDLTSPLARRLIADLDAELMGRYPEPGATHFGLDPDEVAEGRGVFFIAARGGEPVGCGAVRRVADATGEIKRMYVVPAERGRGVGRALLAALEDAARSLGLTRIVLETGTRQAAALALYERAGFARIPPFGEYALSPATSVCMAKTIEPSDGA